MQPLGADQLHQRVVRDLSDIILERDVVFERSLHSGEVPDDGKEGQHHTHLQKGQAGCLKSNSLISTPEHIIEQIHWEAIADHIKNKKGKGI